MWLQAASSGGQDAQNALVLAIVAAVAGLLVAICTGLFQVWAAKQQHNNQQIPENAQVILFERTAVLSARADDSDERDETQDRRLDVLERYLDRDNPTWRPTND